MSICYYFLNLLQDYKAKMTQFYTEIRCMTKLKQDQGRKNSMLPSVKSQSKGSGAVQRGA